MTRWGIGAGMALGLAYAASPLSVWFVLVAIGLFAWAGQGLSDRERRYVWGLMALAIIIRVYAIAVLARASDGRTITSFFWDGDSAYLKQRALVLRDIWAGMPVPPWDWHHAFDRAYGWSSFLLLLAYVQYLTGPAPYGVHLVNVACFMAAAVVLFRVARTAFGRAPALIGLALMLFLPSLIAWSVTALKESLFVLMFAAALSGLVAAVRATRMYQRVLGLVLLAAATAACGTLRLQASSMVVAGLAIGVTASLALRRVAVAVLVLVCVPILAVRLWHEPRVQDIILAKLREAARAHQGNVRTEGYSYQLLDQRMYPAGNVMTMTAEEGLRFMVRGAISFVLVPLPGQTRSRTALLFLPQQMIWYLLVPFACIGLAAGLRRDLFVTCLLAGLIVVTAEAIALTNGNIGTMVRFRDWVVPLIVWLSGLGMTTLASSAVATRTEEELRPCP